MSEKSSKASEDPLEVGIVLLRVPYSQTFHDYQWGKWVLGKIKNSTLQAPNLMGLGIDNPVVYDTMEEAMSALVRLVGRVN